ncbi:MAG: hypothetical protein U0451_00805 [Candidatus Saccharimonadales bacterium]
MAYCEFCPLKEACLEIDEYLETRRSTDEKARQVLEAARTILTIEATDYSNLCPDQLPSVVRENTDGTGGYLIVCSDHDRQGIANYLLSIGVPVGADIISEDQFDEQYPWISLVDRLKER